MTTRSAFFLFLVMPLSLTKFLGDTAVALLQAGAETDKKDQDGHLALDLAPDKEVLIHNSHNMRIKEERKRRKANQRSLQVRKFIIQSAEADGIELS